MNSISLLLSVPFFVFFVFKIEIMQDRRLDQDDNRGLGQGVQDNLPVLNIFKLAFENISPCLKRSDKYRGGFLTSQMHGEMNRLVHPMEKLIWYENDWVGVQPEFGETRWPLETGFEIAALRNIKHVTAGEPKKSTMGLVLNRLHLEQCDGEEKVADTVRVIVAFYCWQWNGSNFLKKNN